MKLLQLEEGEIIVGEVRKHWWKLFTLGLGLTIAAILPFIVITVIFAFATDALPGNTMYVIGFFYSMWLVTLWLIFFVEWTDYYLDIWIITNKRIVDIEQQGLWSRDVATVRLEDVEDIKTESRGVLETFLKFGRIGIQTAGSKQEFFIKNAAHQDKAKELIYKMVSEARRGGQLG